MSDTTQLTEPSSARAHATDELHVLDEPEPTDAIETTHTDAGGLVTARNPNKIASEPAFEFQEAAFAYPAHSPSTTTGILAPPSVPTGEPLGDNDMPSYGAMQDPNAPYLPPRPADEHPAWTHTEHPESQSMNRNDATSGARQGAEHPNPTIAQLKGMFPDFDDVVLQSVLESVNGSQDAAIDVLLGMNDPSYVSTQHITAPADSAVNPSLELDEQLARQLMLEDERQQQQNTQGRWRPSGQSWPRRGSNTQPREQQQQAVEQAGQGPDRAQEIKETFNQIAESGKRTFSSIVSRVKARINEYEQSRQNQQQQSSSQASWSPDSSSQSPEFGASRQPKRHTPYQAHETPSRKNSGLDRHATSQAYAQYYSATGSDDDDGWTPIGHRGRSEDGAQKEIRYDIDNSPEIPPPPGSVAAPPPATSATEYSHQISSNPPFSSPAALPAPDAQPVLRPPPTVAGNPINAAKLGLLPRRPVNLMSSQPTSPTPRAGRTQYDEEEDELDYVENPFEEEHK